jgi:hypothetical protein
MLSLSPVVQQSALLHAPSLVRIHTGRAPLLVLDPRICCSGLVERCRLQCRLVRVYSGALGVRNTRRRFHGFGKRTAMGHRSA